MRVINEKKGIFSFYSPNMKKKSVAAISITVDLNFSIKSVTNQSKDTYHKYYQLQTLHCKVFHWISYPILAGFL